MPNRLKVIVRFYRTNYGDIKNKCVLRAVWSTGVAPTFKLFKIHRSLVATVDVPEGFLNLLPPTTDLMRKKSQYCTFGNTSRFGKSSLTYFLRRTMILTASFIFLSTSLAERGGVKDSGEGILTGVWTGDIVGSYDAWNRHNYIVLKSWMSLISFSAFQGLR